MESILNTHTSAFQIKIIWKQEYRIYGLYLYKVFHRRICLFLFRKFNGTDFFKKLY